MKTPNHPAGETIQTGDLFRETWEHSLDGMRIIDANGIVLSVNDAYCRLVKMERAEIIGKPFAIVYGKKDRELITSKQLELLSKRQNVPFFENEFELWNGSKIWFHVSTSLLSPATGPIRLLSIYRDITEKKIAEQALRESEERYRRLVDLLPFGVAVHVDGRLVYANHAAVKMTGASSADDVLGKPIMDFVHPDYRDIAIRRIQSGMMSTDVSPAVEERFIRLDGTPFDVETLGIPILYQGKPAMQVVFQDIGRRKETEKLMRLTQFSIERSRDSVFWFDRERKIIYANQSACRLLGYSREELLTMSMQAIDIDVPQQEWKWFLDDLKSKLSKTFESRQRAKDGKIIPVEVTCNYVSIDGEEGSFAIVRDISERKAAEEALRHSEQKFRVLSDNSRDLIGLHERDGRYIYVSPSVKELLGYSPDEFTGKSPFDFIHPEDAEKILRDFTGLAFQSRVLEKVEYRMKAKDGSYHWFDCLARPLLDGKGEAIQWQSTSRDVTEHRLIEEALRHTQKMESIGILAGGIAHDFNNLLHALMGHASIALMKLPNDHPAFTAVVKAIQAGERATELTKQLLAYSGRGKFKISTVDLGNLIDENLHLFEVALPKNVILRMDLQEHLPPIEADAAQIQQVIMNLIINGAEAIGTNNGALVLRTATKQIEPAEITWWKYTGKPLKGGMYVTVEIHDTGSGMEPEMIDRIFEPFFTTKFTGRGLGLAAVLGIIKGHDGGLQVESRPGHGTTFRLAFPVSSAPENPVAAEEENISNISTDKAILVIDDEQMILDLVIDMLSFTNMKAIVVNNGVDGIEIFRKRRDEIALVLLDLSMPVMSGVETMKRIREIDPNAKIILSSGYTEEEVIRRYQDIRVAGFLQKPYQPNILLSKIRDML